MTLRNKNLALIRRGWMAVAFSAASAAMAMPVGPATQRPALQTPQATRAVTLGAAQAGDRLVTAGERGIIMLSDDLGAKWRQVAVPVSSTLTVVRFADERHGFAAGHGGIVLSSEDGGMSWRKRLDGRQIAALTLDAAQDSADQRLVEEARRLVSEGPDKPLLDLQVIDGQHVMAVGAYNLAVESLDGGRSWKSISPRLPNPRGLHLYALRVRGETVLIAGEQGLVMRSDDGGRSFKRIETPYKGSFFTAELLGEGHDEMLVAGLRGNVWRSRDGGASWTQLDVPMPITITGSATRGDTLLLANQAGTLLRSESGGPLRQMDVSRLPPLAGLLPLKNNGLLALSVVGSIVLPGVAK